MSLTKLRHIPGKRLMRHSRRNEASEASKEAEVVGGDLERH